MSDDLVKRLRDPAFGTETTERNLMNSAADRIEELEKALTEKVLLELSALGQAQEAYERQLELEAVLSDVDAWVDDLGMYAQEGHEPATVFKRVKEVLKK